MAETYYIGEAPSSPFAPPGVVLTPYGKQSFGGGSAVSKYYTSKPSGGTSLKEQTRQLQQQQLQKQLQEQKAQEEEQKRIQEALKKSQQQIQQQQFAGTIAGQVSTKTDLETSPYVSSIQPAGPPPQQTFGSALRQSASFVVGDIRKFVTGSRDEYYGLSQWGLPFYTVGRIKGEVKAEQYSPIVKKGTISLTESPFYTYGELQSQLEVERKVDTLGVETKYTGLIGAKQKEIQSQIDLGQLELEKGETQLKQYASTIQPEYEKEYQKAYEKYKDIIPPSSYQIRTGADIPKEIGIATDIGAVASGLIAPPIPIAYFTGKGAYYASKKTDFSAAFLDIQSSLEQKDGKFILKETPLSQQYKGYKTKAGISFATAGLFAYPYLKTTEAGILQEQLRTASEKPFEFKEIRIGGKDQLSILKGEKVDRGIIQTLDIRGKIIQEGKYKYLIPEGKGVVSTKGLFDWTTFPADRYGTKILAEQTFDIGAKGVSFSLESIGGKGLALSFPRTTIVPTTSASYIYPATTDSTTAWLKMTARRKFLPYSYTQDIGFGVSRKTAPDLFYSEGGRLRQVDIITSPEFGVNIKSTLDAYGTTKLVSKESLIGGGVYDVGGMITKTITPTQLKSTFLTGVAGTVKTTAPIITKTTAIVPPPSLIFGNGKGVISPSTYETLSESISGFAVYEGKGTYERTPTWQELIAPPKFEEDFGDIGYIKGQEGKAIYDFLYNKPSFKPFQKTPQAQVNLPSQVIKPIFLLGSTQLPSSSLGLRQVPILASSLQPRQELKRLTLQKGLLQSSLAPVFSTPPIVPTGVYTPFKFTPFGFPFLPFGAGGKGIRRSTQLKKQITAYQPSLTGSVLGIKTKVPEDYEKYGFGALKVRGITDTKLVKRIKRKRIL